jgi:hypothetical protein
MGGRKARRKAGTLLAVKEEWRRFSSPRWSTETLVVDELCRVIDWAKRGVDPFGTYVSRLARP